MDGVEKDVIRSTRWAFLLRLVPVVPAALAVWPALTDDPAGMGPFEMVMTGLGCLLALYALYRTGVWLLGPQLNRYEVQPYTLVARSWGRSTTFEWHTIEAVMFVGSRLTWRTVEALPRGSVHLKVRVSGVWHDLPYLLLPGDHRQLRAWNIVSAACERHRVELQTEIVRPGDEPRPR